jgi:hypothetical protein
MTTSACYSHTEENHGVILFSDGSSYKGISFGARVSVAGEAVFQTGSTELIKVWLGILNP